MSEHSTSPNAPNAMRILGRLASDPELSALMDTMVAVWREDGDRRVAAETERCAKIADGARLAGGVNESDNDMFKGYHAAAEHIAAKIRKDRGSDPPQVKS